MATPRSILERIARTVHKSEASSRFIGTGKPSLDGSLAVEDFGNHHAWVRVTGAIDGDGRYPGKVLQFNVADNTLTDLADIYVREVTGGKLVPTDSAGNTVYYRAFDEGDANDGTNVYVPMTGANILTPAGSAAAMDPADYVGTDLAITPTTATISTTPQNNYALPATNWLKVTATTVDVDLNSIVAPSDNATYFITNDSASTKNVNVTNNGGGTAANEFLTSTGSTLALTPGTTAVATYSTTLSKWTAYLITPGVAPNVAYLNLTGSVNNLSLPAGVDTLYVTPDNTGYSITGIEPTGQPGQGVRIVNAGSNSFTVANRSGSSTFGNQINTASGADELLAPGRVSALLYGGVNWNEESTTAGAGGGGSSSGAVNTVQAADGSGGFQATNITDDGSTFTVTEGGNVLQLDSAGLNLSYLSGDCPVTTNGSKYLTSVTPAADGTYTNPTSITISKGIITSIS